MADPQPREPEGPEPGTNYRLTRPGHTVDTSGQPRNHVEEGGSPDGARGQGTRVQGPLVEDLQPGIEDHAGTDQMGQGPGRNSAGADPGVVENEGTGQKLKEITEGRSSSTTTAKRK